MTAVECLEAAARGELESFYCIGGNFLETMPEPARMRAALARVPLRLHSDIVLTSQMLVEPAETAYLLPAATRYEQRDGGTETSTERRVIFSPHIPGHEIGEARSEWEMLLELARAVRPESAAALGCSDGPAIRAEIARAVPCYAGIEKLGKKGDQFQWGGPHLCSERRFPTEDGKAHFRAARPPQLDAPPPPPGTFLLATRRGKQFNSMVQRERDPLTGADRDHVFIHPDDAAALGLQRDDAVEIRSASGSLRGRAFPAEVARGTLQAHWPEANVLIRHGVVDAGGGVPDYNARVTLARA
jgi:anaerobic selenocysteine-containing dehydrogenase